MQKLQNKRTLMAINAFLAVVVGLVLLLAPQDSLGNVAFISGLLILISGVFLVLGTFIYSEGQKTHPIWLVEGVVNIALGVILMLNPSWLFQFILMLAGIWAFVVGVLQFYVASSATKDGLKGSAVPLILSGIVSLGVGVFLFVKPYMVADLLLLILGGISLLVGGVMLIYAFKLQRQYVKARKAAKNAAKEEKLAQEEAAKLEAEAKAGGQLMEKTQDNIIPKDKKGFLSFWKKK